MNLRHLLSVLAATLAALALTASAPALPAGEPAVGLDQLTAVIAGYFERAIAPWWPAIRAALEADIVHRARRLTAGGAIEVFEDLHPQVQWREGVLEVERPYDEDVDLRGRGLLLVPAAFAWPEVSVMVALGGGV